VLGTPDGFGQTERQEGNGAGDGHRLPGRNKALKGEPQERDRHETRPGGFGRRKAPRGCENLKAHTGGIGRPAVRVAARGRENAEGEGTSREELLIASAPAVGDGGGSVHGVVSEGGWKPKRGTRRIHDDFSGARSAKTLKLSLWDEEQEGCTEPVGC
jgi:hypothetical protein